MFDQLQLTPKLENATSPHDFLNHTAWICCNKCRNVTKHKIRMDGVRTYYYCECGESFRREGAIK